MWAEDADASQDASLEMTDSNFIGKAGGAAEILPCPFLFFSWFWVSKNKLTIKFINTAKMRAEDADASQDASLEMTDSNFIGKAGGAAKILPCPFLFFSWFLSIKKQTHN